MTTRREQQLNSIFTMLDQQKRHKLPALAAYIGPYGTPAVENNFSRRDSRLIVCIEGEVVIKHSNQHNEIVELVMQKGDIAFVDMNSWFAPMKSGSFKLMGLLLNNSRLEVSVTTADSLPFHEVLIALSTNRYTHPNLFKFYDLIREFSEAGSGNYLGYLSSIIILQIREFIEDFVNNPPGKTDKSNFQFQNLMAYIGEYPHLQISRKTLADNLEINADYINELFRRFMHNSFKETISRLRLERARDMAKKSTLKIRDIAKLCGFNSQQNFIYAFGKYFTITPLRMRKLLASSKTTLEELIMTHQVHDFNVKKIKLGTTDVTNEVAPFDENIKKNLLIVNLVDRPLDLYFMDGNEKMMFATIEFDERIRLYGCSQRTEWKIIDKSDNVICHFSIDKDNTLAIICE